MSSTVGTNRLFFPAFLILFCTSSGYACLCDGTPTVAEDFKQATVVFSGVYLGAEFRKGIKNQLREMERAEGRNFEYEVMVQRFRVETFWKGNPASEVVLVT